MSNFIFFYGGPFSQWFASEFTVLITTYNCAEQYMMARKAIQFNDVESWRAILKADNPRLQKALGRQVHCFDAKVWATVCRKIVYDGNYAKFTQNETLKQILLDTGDNELVEASPYDTVWGIGLGEEDPDRFDKSKWKGTNWLGEELMRVRTALQVVQEKR